MDGTKLARIRLCQSCPHWRNAPANIWRWPRCLFGGDEDAAPYLDNAFLEGPERNCPAGKWEGLEPIDMEAEAEESRLLKAQNQVKFWGPVMEALPVDARTALDIIETAHPLEPEARSAIENELRAK